MRMLIPLLIKYTRLIEEVDADLSRGVDDLLVAHEDAYMRDSSILIAEKSQISGAGFLQEIHQIAASHLLRGIAGEEQATQAGANLHQA